MLVVHQYEILLLHVDWQSDVRWYTQADTNLKYRRVPSKRPWALDLPPLFSGSGRLQG